MTFDKQNLDIDSTMIVMGLGYATALLVLVGWVATLVF